MCFEFTVLLRKIFQLIVLDRLVELRSSPTSEKVLRELVMDVLRVLSASDLEVRKKTLQLALDLVSSRNVEEMVMYLKKVTYSNIFWLWCIHSFMFYAF